MYGSIKRRNVVIYHAGEALLKYLCSKLVVYPGSTSVSLIRVSEVSRFIEEQIVEKAAREEKRRTALEKLSKKKTVAPKKSCQQPRRKRHSSILLEESSSVVEDTPASTTRRKVSSNTSKTTQHTSAEHQESVSSLSATQLHMNDQHLVGALNKVESCMIDVFDVDEEFVLLSKGSLISKDKEFCHDTGAKGDGLLPQSDGLDQLVARIMNELEECANNFAEPTVDPFC